MAQYAPVVLFVYNRPQHTQRTIQHLLANTLAKETEVFIFCDGAKSDKDNENVRKVREFVDSVKGFKNIVIKKNDQNQGLANSVIAGVSSVIQEYKRVIVFEDDLLSSPFTLEFFNKALDFYENQSRVMHINGYMYPIKSSDNLPELFFNRFVGSWGWATWDRAWQFFMPDVDDIIRKFDEQKVEQFSFEYSMNFWKQINELKKGEINSWAIRWYASVFLHQGLSLCPAHSLIHNIGHDASGIHSGKNNMYDVAINQHKIITFPDKIEENKLAYQAIKEFYKKRKGSLFQRAIRFAQEKILK